MKPNIHFILSNGAGLHADDLKHLLDKSYESKPSDYGDFIVDKQLSGKRFQVYHNPKTGQVVYSHRGTASLQDWYHDFTHSLLNDTSNARFRYAAEAQKRAYEKYSQMPGVQQHITIGHSLGSKLSQHAATPDSEILTHNGLVTPYDLFKKSNPNQVDIRTKSDVVSVLNKNKKLISKL